MSKKGLPIAVFDSGLGGISVLKELKLALPDENFIYYGDTATTELSLRTDGSLVVDVAITDMFGIVGTKFVIK